MLDRRQLLAAGGACLASCAAPPRRVAASTEALDALLAAHALAHPEAAGAGANHYPMAAEALETLGHEHAIEAAWSRGAAGYAAPWPRVAPLTTDERAPLGGDTRASAGQSGPDTRGGLGEVARAALGVRGRLGDWLDLFETELAVESWRAVLARWAPRLAPGLAGAAFHGLGRRGPALAQRRRPVARVDVALSARSAERSAPKRPRPLDSWECRLATTEPVVSASRETAKEAHQTMRIHSTAFLLVVPLLTSVPGSPAGQEESFAMTPFGAEGFAVLREFFRYDEEVPLEVRQVERVDEPGSVREKLVFRGVRDSRVPAYLALPTTGDPPFPCVILLHGIGSSKAGWWLEEASHSGRLLKDGLLAAGFCVLALDAEYHGERLANNDFESATVFTFQRGWVQRARDMIVQSVVEHRRAIDVLETRDDVDASRVGIVGYSMGGMTAFMLAAVETRVFRGGSLCATARAGRPLTARDPPLRSADCDPAVPPPGGRGGSDEHHAAGGASTPRPDPESGEGDRLLRGRAHPAPGVDQARVGVDGGRPRMSTAPARREDGRH